VARGGFGSGCSDRLGDALPSGDVYSRGFKTQEDDELARRSSDDVPDVPEWIQGCFEEGYSPACVIKSEVILFCFYSVVSAANYLIDFSEAPGSHATAFVFGVFVYLFSLSSLNCSSSTPLEPPRSVRTRRATGAASL